MFKKIPRKIFFLGAIFIINLNCMQAFALTSMYLGLSANYVNLRANSASSYKGVAPGLHLGYGGWMSEYLYLALEGFGMTEPYNTGNDNDIISLKTRYTYGLSLIPAVNLDDSVLAYLRLGYVRTSFKNLDTIKNAYQVGIGLEAPITGCLSVRVEYDYTPYSSVAGLGTVESNQGSLALIYRFEPILSGSIFA